MSVALDIEERPLGREGASIARVALGCGNFGGVGSALDLVGQGLTRDEAFALMDAAWEAGIHHFDTADAYAAGASETIVGQWIAQRGVRPALTTKTFNPMAVGADHGLAPARVTRQLHSSLERLGVDSVELYLCHEFDPDVPVPDTFGVLEEAASQGLIGHYGVSNWSPSQLRAGLAAGAPVAVQNSLSLLDRGDAGEMLSLCAQEGVAYLAFSPLAGGWLTGKYRRGQPFPAGSRMSQRPQPYAALVRDETFDLLERLAALARDRDMSLAGLALAWLLADERVSQIVLGPGRPEHLEPVRQALAHPLSPGELDV